MSSSCHPVLNVFMFYCLVQTLQKKELWGESQGPWDLYESQLCH